MHREIADSPERVEAAERDGVPLEVYCHKYTKKNAIRLRPRRDRDGPRVSRVSYEIRHAETGETVRELQGGNVHDDRAAEDYGRVCGFVAGYAHRQATEDGGGGA